MLQGLWLNDLQHTPGGFLAVQSNLQKFDHLEGGGSVVFGQVRIMRPMLHSLQISTGFVATCIINQRDKVLLFKSFGA